MYTCYRSYFITSAAIITLTTNVLGIPNYFDPKNIINASDPFWSFGLTREGIMQLRDFPSAQKELWEKIRKHAHDFKEYATKRMDEKTETNAEEAELYKQATETVERAEQEARAILFPVGLSDSERANLNNIINEASPQNVLDFDKHTRKLLRQLKTPRMGGSRFPEQVAVRIELEKTYAHLTASLAKLEKNEHLSRKDHDLITNAKKAAADAYNTIHAYVDFSK